MLSPGYIYSMFLSAAGDAGSDNKPRNADCCTRGEVQRGSQVQGQTRGPALEAAMYASRA